ncbi:MAG: pyridoxal phosphate-dependent aminotransferase [Nitrospira sp.]|nr:pyridoxal phosphate-dependent aminotransferase [Nitrospira sp.]
MMATELMRALPFSARAERLIGQEMFKVMDRAQALEREGYTIYHLELGNPRFTPPQEIIDATLGAIHAKQLGYSPMAGVRELRDAIAERVSGKAGRLIGGDSVAISPTNLLISQFLDLTCNLGDRVVLFTPAFPSYWAAAGHIGLNVIPVPLSHKNRFQLDEAQIDAALTAQPKAIIVNSANNPTGAVYTQSMLSLLARRCEEEHIWLLSDETYAELAFAWPFFSLAACELSQLVVISSFSKVFSIPGYRVGYALANPAVVEKLALSTSTLISCLPIFSQVGCLAGLSVLDQYAEGVRAYCRRVTCACAEVINRSDVVRCTIPESGFYLFVDISRTRHDDVSFCRRLLEERHTAVTPGRSFGVGCESFVRLATCGQEEDVMEGTRRVVELAGELGGCCVKAA